MMCKKGKRQGLWFSLMHGSHKENFQQFLTKQIGVALLRQTGKPAVKNNIQTIFFKMCMITGFRTNSI